MNTLQMAAQGYVSLKERLLAQFPELAEDEQALLDTLEGESDLQEQIVSVIRSTLEDEANVEALKALMARMSDRCKRISERAKSKRATVAEMMAETGLKKITAPDFTVSMTFREPGIVIYDEAALPRFLIRQKITEEPDKVAIKAALAQGPIAGAQWGNSYPLITVRTA